MKIILCGACGKMGGNVLSLLENDPEAQAVCGVDLYPREIGIPVYKTFSEITETADVIIDFSSPIGLKERLDYAKANGLGIVLAATGFTKEDLDAVIAEIPADRIGTPDEVANLCLQLINGPGYLTGQIISLDGGWI